MDYVWFLVFHVITEVIFDYESNKIILTLVENQCLAENVLLAMWRSSDFTTDFNQKLKQENNW